MTLAQRLPAILFACYAVAFVDRALVGVAGPAIKHDLGLSDTAFGLVGGTAFAVLFCLCGIPLGWLADRTDRRMMIAAGLVFWSAMTALTAFAHSLLVLALARIGVGLGEAVLLPAGMSLLGSCTPVSLLGRSVSIFLMGAAFGTAFAHLAGGFLLIRLADAGAASLPLFGAIAPWRSLFLLASPPGLLVAAVVMTIAEPPRAGRGASVISQLRAAAVQLWAGRRAYGCLTAATACTVTLTQAQAVWLPLFYVRAFGLSPGESAVQVGIMFIGSVPLGQWIGGALIDRFHARGVLAPPNTVLALCASLSLVPAAVFCEAPSPRVSQMAYVAFSLLVSAATPSGLTGWRLLTPGPLVGSVVAILVAAVTLVGVGLGPAAIGALTDHVFHDEGALDRAMLVVFATSGTLGTLFALAGRRAFQTATARVTLDAPVYDRR